MSHNELLKLLTDMQELRRMADEIDKEIHILQNHIQAHMGAVNADQLVCGPFSITWKPVETVRINSAALKHDLPEIWERYRTVSSSMRFTVR